MTTPKPLTSPDCDLRDFGFMPLDIVRLFGSEFHALSNDTEWRAGVTLWLKSFHQVPAASLPDDDIALARLAEFGRDLRAWRKVRAMALRCWVKCSDGRLYHPVVAEKANEAWTRKRAMRERGRKGNEKRWGLKEENTNVNNGSGVAQGSHNDPTAMAQGSQGTGTGTGTVKETTEADASASFGGSEEDLFWGRIKGLEAQRITRDRCLQLLKATGNDFAQANQILDGAENATKPSGYIGGAIKRLQAEAGNAVPHAANPTLPGWVNDRRAAGIPVERTRTNNWRCLGETLNDAGEVIGF